MLLSQFPVTARIAPFAAYLLVLALEGQASSWLPEFDARWLYPVKIMLVLGVLATFRLSYTELRGAKLSFNHVMLSLGAGLTVFVVWINLAQPWAVIGELGAGYDPRNAGQIDWLLVAFRLAGAALVVPLMEELFWRSLFMRWIVQGDFMQVQPATVSASAILISSVVFGFEHHQWLAGIIAGLVYAWLYCRTGHLNYAIFAHAVTNGALGAWVVMTGQWSYW